MIGRQYAEELLQAGLDSFVISIYSHQAEVHNDFSRQRKLFDKATNAVRIFADLCKQYPRFRVKTQTIILRENFRYFKELIQFHQSLGSCRIRISYLEGDFDKKHILNEKEIIEFKNYVVPKALELCSKLHPSIRNMAMERIKSIYGDKIGNPFDISQGKYWRQKSCKIPQQYTTVLANGDVHPCNIVEYTHEPIMGNLFENSFKEIWVSKRWNDFRQNLHEKCHLCPMNIHTSIPLKPEKSTFSFTRLCKNALKSLRS